MERLQELLERMGDIRAVVIGDFFLDQYWVVDPELEETSLETGLRAHQVVEVRHSPGAAGTVTNNLCALGVGQVKVIGLVGDDGPGWELRRDLERRGAVTAGLLTTPGRLTPVYTKPMFRRGGVEQEGERFDLKNRFPTSEEDQRRVIQLLRRLTPGADAVLVMDQVAESDAGVVGTAVREEIHRLAKQSDRRIWLADSRFRIGEFRHVLIKPNRQEASRAAGLPPDAITEILTTLFRRTGRPVLVTLAEEGMAGYDGVQMVRLPGVPVSGPIDPVGAGDSASAALAAALAAGASLGEAMQLALLAASVTIRQIGTTGVATPEQILAAALAVGSQ
ncbi:MAG: bifunctional ADP-heptose synthase [Acidobacteriota bacterium]